ncbi:MAG: C-terminal binding protein [Chloroflexota bacterium]
MAYKVVARAGMMGTEIPELAGIGAEYVAVPLKTEDDIIAAAKDADAVMVGAMEPYTRKAIAGLEKCKVISRMGIGYDNIDIEAATEYGIPVAYVPDASIHEVSDQTIALVLCLGRRLVPISRAVSDGAWAPGRTELNPLRGALTRLSNQTLGLVGLGRIGSLTCQKAKAFNLRVIIYDPYMSAGDISKIGAEKVELEQLLKESDYVSLHAPLTKETRRLLGLEQFKKMKPTAFLVNTARGGLVDEAALATALKEGYLAGAGLDVTDPEPPKPDNPLLKMDNVMITGHSAWLSRESGAEVRQRTVTAVLDALSGRWPKDLVNPQVKDRPNSRLKK